MSYFEGINYFLLSSLVMIVSAVLCLSHKRSRVWITASSAVMALIIYSHHPKQLIYLSLYLIIEWANISWYLKMRKLHKRSKPYYYIALAAALSPLVLNKLSPLLTTDLFGFLGLSYISFKSIQIIIEIYDNLIKEMDIRDFLPFMLFFPTMSSGPIDRSRRFTDDLNRELRRDEYIEMLGQGLLLLVMGAFYKYVLSDITFKLMQKTTVSFRPHYLIAYSYLYGFYLFFDFAGYSSMAVGTAYIMGIKTPMNFDKPFISVNIKDFWNRWHITLSHWFRDFVFSRLVKNFLKAKRFKSMLTTASISYLVNMAIMGVWHGLSPSYILYGLYHGSLLAINEVYEQKSEFYKEHKDKKTYRLVSGFLTFNMVMFGFLIFSSRFLDAVQYLLSMF